MPNRLTTAGIVCLAGLLLAGVSATSAETASPMDARFQKEIRPILTTYCYGCHGNGRAKGNLAIDSFNSIDAIQNARVTWEAISDNVALKFMPPEDARHQPGDADRKTLVAFIDQALAYFDPNSPRGPGFVPIRRLNRSEYNNTIRDLVGVDFRPADDFPADDTGYGFDNIAAVLTMSPLLAEKYLAAAEQVMDRAVPTPEPVASPAVHFDATAMRSAVGSRIPHTRAWVLPVVGEISRLYDFREGGKYEFRISAAQDPAGKEPARMAFRIDNRDVQLIDVPNRRGQWRTFTVRVDLRPGQHRIAAAFMNDMVDPDNRDPGLRDRNLLIESISFQRVSSPAPAPTEAQKRIFFVTPSRELPETEAARQIIGRFASRAYRRPATSDEVSALMRLHADAREQGDAFVPAVRQALTAVLVSPRFLFRIEADPSPDSTQPRLLDEYELATRLSYFLWSSMPDDELLDLAGRHRLRSDLENQVRRMIADPRSSALIANFGGQWLELRNLDEHTTDPTRYPEFNDALRRDMKHETELFFSNLIHQDEPITDLLTADYSFVNERLAKLYRIPDVTGDQFRRVSLKGTPRAGVLTQASVLTLTAMAARTSPVRRGKFVLDQILGTPPPPPPPNVPQLSEKPTDVASAPLRKRMEAHREDPNCATCHIRMDAIGFSLENFDALGRWRTRDGAFPIDSVGVLAGGYRIEGAQGLRKYLLARKGDFVHCFIEKLLTYALGRGPEPVDRATIHDITLAAGRQDYRFSSVILGIVRSDAFQKRIGRKGPP